MSDRSKFPGGGIKLAGDNGIALVGSLNVLTVSDRDFTMAFASVIKV